jgi:hypothetical protein
MYFLDDNVLTGVNSIEVIKGDSLHVTDPEILNEWLLWKEFFSRENKKISGAFIRRNVYQYKITGQSIEGLASKFSKIKTEKELISFATTYGMLGLSISPDYKKLLEPFIPKFNGIEVAKALTDIGDSHYEPFELWWHHIAVVRKIMKLYRALVRTNKNNSVEIEENILRTGKPRKNKKGMKMYTVLWYDNTSTHVSLNERELEEMSFAQIGRKVLIKSIGRYTRCVNIVPTEIIETEKSDLGFYVLEKKATPYLITAIYYDLWKLINANVIIEICANERCKLPYVKTKRQKYCSNACKQEAYRIRKEQQKQS